MGKCSIEKWGIISAKNPGKLREKTLNRKNSPGKSLGNAFWGKYSKLKRDGYGKIIG